MSRIYDVLEQSICQSNTEKTRRVTVDRVRINLIADVIYIDWYEQALCTETRIKAFFSAKDVWQVKQIDKDLQRLASGGNVTQTIAKQDDDAQ